MKSRYQRLLPGTAPSNAPKAQSTGNDKAASSLPTCSVNPIACEQCRRKKAKCDGQRPTCERCFRNGTACHYDADVGESRFSTLKKKFITLDKEVKQLRKEVHQLRRLYGYTQAKFPEEAYNVFMQIRLNGNIHPIRAPRPFDHDDVVEAEEFKESPNATEMSDEPGIESISAFGIEVPALPWTVVAGNEVVSKLICQYFAFDYLYVFPPIPRSTFISEMKEGDATTATCCSPLLVNAICAQQCFLSSEKHLGTVPCRSMAEQFLEESNRILQTQSGPMSLATCQATCLIYAAVLARDRLNATLNV